MGTLSTSTTESLTKILSETTFEIKQQVVKVNLIGKVDSRSRISQNLKTAGHPLHDDCLLVLPD